MNGKITFILMLIVLLHLDQTNAKLRVMYNRVEAMKVSNESKVRVVFLRIAPHNNSYYQAEMDVLEDLISSKLKISVVVVRCAVGEAPDTCEYLIKLNPPNACLVINAENVAWNAISDAYTPKLRCPLKKGKYVADNISYEPSKWNIFPLDNWHFKIAFKVYEGDVLTISIIIEAHFIRVH